MVYIERSGVPGPQVLTSGDFGPEQSKRRTLPSDSFPTSLLPGLEDPRPEEEALSPNWGSPRSRRRDPTPASDRGAVVPSFLGPPGSSGIVALATPRGRDALDKGSLATEVPPPHATNPLPRPRPPEPGSLVSWSPGSTVAGGSGVTGKVKVGPGPQPGPPT